MALSDFFDLFTGSKTAGAYDLAGRRLTDAMGAYGGFANRASDELSTNYMKALEQFAPFQQGGATGMQAYLEGLGLTGPEGRDAAVGRYIAGPGVQNAILQATDAINRAGNAGGVAIGNSAKLGADAATNIALNDYYKNYMGGLLPLLNMGQTGAAAAGNIYTGLGGGLANILTRQGDVGITGAGKLGEYDVAAQGARTAGAGNAVKLGLAGLSLGTSGGAGLLGLGSNIFQGMTGKTGLLGSGSNWYG